MDECNLFQPCMSETDESEYLEFATPTAASKGDYTEDEEELRKLAVAVDNFQMAVADVSQFQRNFLNLIRTSAKYGAPGDQGKE